jgi:hypothetical protein
MFCPRSSFSGYLCYYEAEQLHEDVDRLKPRGVLNLGNPDEHKYVRIIMIYT